MRAAMLQDVAPKTHAMTRPVNSPDEIRKIYDFVAYPKAASVIRMIEHIMTPEVFQKSLEVYIQERYENFTLAVPVLHLGEIVDFQWKLSEVSQLFSGVSKLPPRSNYLKF